MFAFFRNLFFPPPSPVPVPDDPADPKDDVPSNVRTAFRAAFAEEGPDGQRVQAMWRLHESARGFVRFARAVEAEHEHNTRESAA